MDICLEQAGAPLISVLGARYCLLVQCIIGLNSKWRRALPGEEGFPGNCQGFDRQCVTTCRDRLKARRGCHITNLYFTWQDADELLLPGGSVMQLLEVP